MPDLVRSDHETRAAPYVPIGPRAERDRHHRQRNLPGWVLTPPVERQLQDRAQRNTKYDLVTEKQPMVAFSIPEQIEALVCFLCSDAARVITGAPLSIDGGWTTQ